MISSQPSKHLSMSKLRWWPLIEWQRILGWINWGLNAYPLVRPALQPAYAKISGKQISCAQLHLNHTVIQHFLGLAETMESSDGIHMLDAMEWVQTDADMIIYSDASCLNLDTDIIQSLVRRTLIQFCLPRHRYNCVTMKVSLPVKKRFGTQHSLQSSVRRTEVWQEKTVTTYVTCDRSKITDKNSLPVISTVIRQRIDRVEIDGIDFGRI